MQTSQRKVPIQTKGFKGLALWLHHPWTEAELLKQAAKFDSSL